MTDNDDDDLFGDNAHLQRPNPFEGLSAEEIAELKTNWKAPRKRSTTPRDKPEKRNQDRIFKHLVSVYGAVPRRVNAGQWHTPEGNVIMGAKAGTSDLIVLISFIIGDTTRIGVYFAVETKSMTGRTTPEQDQFIARVKAMGGAACVARTTLDIDDAITRWADQLSATLGQPVRAAKMRSR